MKALGIDIGGSAVKGAPVDLKTGRLLAERHRIPISRRATPAKVAAAVREIVRHFAWRGPVGIGFPGVIAGNRILTSANLHPRFIGCDGVRLFSRAAGRPVALINDAAAAAHAEMTFGAGRGFAGKTLLVTLGTGVGTALAQDGVVFACELGHFPWDGKSAEKYVGAAARDREDLSWNRWGKRLGKYLRQLEALLWPDRIVIGGGASAKHGKFFPCLQDAGDGGAGPVAQRRGHVGAALWAERKR